MLVAHSQKKNLFLGGDFQFCLGLLQLPLESQFVVFRNGPLVSNTAQLIFERLCFGGAIIHLSTREVGMLFCRRGHTMRMSTGCGRDGGRGGSGGARTVEICWGAQTGGGAQMGGGGGGAKIGCAQGPQATGPNGRPK